MSRAQIKISVREIEVRLLKMAKDAVDKQVSAMSKAIEMVSAKLDEKVDTKFQGFAPTFSDYLDSKWCHLDILNRFSFMQSWLTKLKNRGVDVETLTSGPGIVFTYKDLNESLQSFCNLVLFHSEKEMRSRTQGF